MKKIGLFLIVTAVFFPAVLLFAQRDNGMMLAENFFIPEGDPAAGKQAFTDLKCAACHWVKNQNDLLWPVAEQTGPMIGAKQAGYSPGWLANSIISPSHTIAVNSNGEAEGSELSRMGSFTEIMTVQQMIDLVAYIRSLKED